MIRPVGFLDVSTFTARFILNYRQRLSDDPAYPGVQTIMLRSVAGAEPILKEWKSAREVLERLRNAVAPFLGGKPAVLGKAMVASLKPGGWTDWAHSDDEYAQGHLRLYVNMIPSPLAFIYSGGEAQNPLVGQITLFEQQALHSEINLGAVARVSLIVDVKRPVASAA